MEIQLQKRWKSRGNIVDKLKFGIIGCGRISVKHIEAIVNNKDEAELVAIYDIIREFAIDKKKNSMNLR